MDSNTYQCKDCGSDFDLTSGEEDFYVQKGLSKPLRCVKCRAIRKEQKQSFNNYEPKGGEEATWR